MRVSPLISSLLAVAFLGGAGVVAYPDVLPGVRAEPSVDAGSESESEPEVDATGTATPSELAVVPSTPSVAAALPIPPDRNQVILDLGALLANPEYDTLGSLSLSVLDQDGRLVIERSPALGLLPASTMKMVTAAAALALHGEDATLETEVLIDGAVSSRGTLDGNVYVVAGGDPTLASIEFQQFVYPIRPATDTRQLVELLRGAGIQRVTGDVVADPGAYADDRLAEGWRETYLNDFDARYITGLTVDAGLDVTIKRARSDWPQLAPEDLGNEGIRVKLAADPVARAAEVLREELARARMSVEGEARVGNSPASAISIGAMVSAPLGELLTFMVKRSDNHIADTLFREIGAQVTGRSTWDSSSQAVRALLADLGVDLDSAVLKDGSGLSRGDLLSARLLAELDQRMASSPDGELWASLHAVAGEDGTLRRRLRDTIADGRFRGKTGTLNDVRALVGAVQGPNGQRFHLAIIGNGGEVWRATTLADQMILRLTRSLWCSADNAPDDVVLACAA
ncbi:MAG: D-alanyl-D-alanine carboxypeptidase/D-alanyl-D-alanine-endopeptidase (penicillin-binding protein 4) [Glaciecola sp.]|jgi:D-alanyl-D-alanine carboxypeptidase/D-alanyl-D-alanine-endopeptidase (penicillin-binding protein 4)